MPAIAFPQIGTRSRLLSDQRGPLDIGPIVLIGSLGSDLGRGRVIGLSVATVI